MNALAIAVLAVCASAAAHQRYAAVDMSPVRGALVPRFLIDAPKLAIRDGGICNPNYHSCVDIGFPETCCANTNYCYVKPDNRPWCCPVGSNCDSNCAATAYQCFTTVTRTISETVTGGGGGGGVVTTSVSSACCGRTCPSTSAFRCESRFGGGCCSYGQTCVSGGGCARAVTPTTSATALTPVDPGCTATTQHACADGGCCDRLWDCVVVSGTAACAPGRPTATDVRIVDEASDGLSTGAKAGIGVGVSVVGCALVVLSAWFCLFRRRRRGTATASSRPNGGGGGGASRVSGGVSGIGSGGGSERPGRSARAMSEVTSSSRPTMWRGGTQEYFGPDAVAGPYTETETTTPGRGRGVPLQAHSPRDVVAPVEMDSVGVVAEAEAEVEAAQERYELYGSEVASSSAGSIAGFSMMDRSPGPRVRGGHSA